MSAMIIDGRLIAGAGAFEVINPATEEVFAEAPACSRAQLDEAVAAAAAAFPAWSSALTVRRALLAQCADIVKAHADELAQLLTLEQGKPLAKAKREIMGSSNWFRYTAGLQIPCEVIQDDELMRIEVRRKPYGVVGAITPWNYPVMLAVWKIAPALLAGNTVVLKPSPYTPLATLRLGELLREILPKGVLNIVTGGDEVGQWITSHPSVRKISFTGSISAGKHVAASAALDLKRVTLELGGNDAAIVLDDIDPAAMAQKIFWGAFENSGQVCAAIKRVYVHTSVYQPLLDAMTQLARSVNVGDGRDERTEIGPINNRPQFERVQALVEDAKRAGGTAIVGGARVGDKGYFYAPTLITGLADDAGLVAEEQFGPVLPVLPFTDIDDAITRANATPFGLSGSVWSGNTQRAAAIAHRLDCGTVWINQHLVVAPHVPVGGMKSSGIGVENGPWGLLAFTEIQTVEIPQN